MVEITHEISVVVSSAGMDAGNKARITLNDVEVKMGANESEHHRGLNIVVIDPSFLGGKVVFAQAFDTYTSSLSLEGFIKTFPIIYGADKIIVVACKDECTKNMSQSVKTWFTDQLGSREILNLNYRHGFSLIKVLGTNTLTQEKVSVQKRDTVSISQVFEINLEARIAPKVISTVKYVQ